VKNRQYVQEQSLGAARLRDRWQRTDDLIRLSSEHGALDKWRVGLGWILVFTVHPTVMACAMADIWWGIPWLLVLIPFLVVGYRLKQLNDEMEIRS